MANQYGLDTHYFKKNLNRILQEIECYTPDEMHLALYRLSETAKPKEKLPARSCTMSCGKSTGDTRSWEEMKRNCDDCIIN